MQSERSLIERIASPPFRSRVATKKSEDEVAESVLRHLRKMLNTRQGDAKAQLNYGMPDITDFVGSPAAIEDVQRAIKSSIENFEHRVTRPVRVRYISEGDADWPNLRFEIVVKLRMEDESTSIRYQTTVEPSGRVSVRR